jgi:hypothetical protein
MADKTQEKRSDTLQKYVSDMVALEDHIANAVKQQTGDDSFKKHDAKVIQIVHKIEAANKTHHDVLKHHLEMIGGDSGHGLKEMATDALGTIAGLYDKVRTQTVSKMLRDDYTALSLASMGYTMLHTTGLALRDQTTADLALRNLNHYTDIIMELAELIPQAVVDDLRDEVGMVNEAAAQEARRNTQRTWQPDGSDKSDKSSNGSSQTSTASTITSGTSGTQTRSH